MDAIIVENLSKKFRRYDVDRPASLKEAFLQGLKRLGAKEIFWALRGVNFRIERGRAVGIVGANGAGKSTLLRLIGGVGKPDAGTIQINGRLGAVLDLTAGFHPDLTGRENVFVTGVICGLTRAEVAERFDEIVAFAELEEFIDSPIRTYSTGMQMRLGFSIAAHTDPDVLLIDEVLAVGDIAFQQKCMARIEQFKKSGCTIVLVSHDPAQTKKLCDEVIWLRGGRVVAHGNPEVVVGEYVAELASETRRRTPATQPPITTSFGTELQVNKNRFGSMEMEITAVALLDADRRPVTEFKSGESLCVQIDFRAAQPIANPIFSVTISREDGFLCFDTNTAAQGLPMPLIEGGGRITLHIERLDFATGNYFVDVGIYESEWAYGYDYHWHAYPLRVNAPTPDKGLLHLPQSWELKMAGKMSASGETASSKRRRAIFHHANSV